MKLTYQFQILSFYITYDLKMDSSPAERIIVLVDMDCFYVQVEQKLHPEYQNKPCAVVQYETWRGGSILAVNYEAQAKGVTRFLHGDEALKKCPDIHFFSVPEIRGKGDLARYREAGTLVLDVLCEYCDCVERASIDEAFLDITSEISSRMLNTPPVTVDQLPNTFVIGWESENPDSRESELQKWLQMIYEEEHLYNDRMLAVAAVIVEEIRQAVYEKTGFTCSAGVAHNKMLAKLSCGINKPNKQTVLPQSSVQLLFKSIPIKKVRNLGGKLGKAIVKKFNVENMGDLIDISKSQFVSQFGEKTSNWLYNLVRGIENEPVISRQLPKSVGCGKIFPKQGSLSTKKDVTHWLKQLASELEERLIKDQNDNKRFARLLTVSVRNRISNGYSLVSRSCPIHAYNAEKLAHDALLAISKLNTSSSETLWTPSIYTLSIVASKFENKLDNSCSSIQSYLIPSKSPEERTAISMEDECSLSPSTAAGTANSRTEKSLNDSTFKLAKNSSCSSQNITSFFTSKHLGKIDTVNNSEAVISKEIQNIDQNSDDFVQGNKSDSVSADEFSDAEKVNVNKDTKDLIEKLAKPLGFFAKKLAERSEFNLPIEFETFSDDDDILGETNVKSVPSTSSISDICSDLDPELTKLCDQCNKRIPVWEETEHLDYHLAVNLSKELSKPPLINNSVVSKNFVMERSSVKKSKEKNRKRSSTAKSPSQAKKSIQKKHFRCIYQIVHG